MHDNRDGDWSFLCAANGACLTQRGDKEIQRRGDTACVGDCLGLSCQHETAEWPTANFCLKCALSQWEMAVKATTGKKRPREETDDNNDDATRTMPLPPEKRPRLEARYELVEETTKAAVAAAVEQPESDGLSESQSEALDYALRGENLFITGGAGCGKSFIIDRIQRELEAMGLSVYLTATTGAAAWNIGGTTFHRYLGCGIAEAPLEQLVTALKKSYKKRNAEMLRKSDVLIIDEVSMFNASLFVKFDGIMRALRGRRPFGGVQLIIVGDFLQLPPVVKPLKTAFGLVSDPGPRYIFQTQNWRDADFRMVNLVHNFRQSGDTRFQALLNNARIGALTRDDERLLRERIAIHNHAARADVTRIFSRKVDVQQRNQEELQAIKKRKVIYEGVFSETNGNTKENSALFKHIPIEDRLALKVGALVLLCCNLDVNIGLYNGTPGRVVGFKSPMATEQSETDMESDDVGADVVYRANHATMLPVVCFDNDEGTTLTIQPYTWEMREKDMIVATYENLPLILRYAITTHKSQGQTLPSAMIDMKCFETGQCYTSLSRVRRLEDLYILNYDKTAVAADKLVLDFYRENKLL
jgi:ATP-dependent DNA helicase PIF1